MFKDFIRLKKYDDTTRRINANVKTVSRDEFYKSVETSLNAGLEVKIRKASYQNEKEFEYRNIDFFIVRTHEDTSDFMYVIGQESDLKSQLYLIKRTFNRKNDGTFEDELDRKEQPIECKLEFSNTQKSSSISGVKIKHERKVKIKTRYKEDIDISDLLEINGKTYEIESINDLLNLSVWQEIIAVEVF
jgi:hypothetical protein